MANGSEEWKSVFDRLKALEGKSLDRDKVLKIHEIGCELKENADRLEMLKEILLVLKDLKESEDLIMKSRPWSLSNAVIRTNNGDLSIEQFYQRNAADIASAPKC